MVPKNNLPPFILSKLAIALSIREGKLCAVDFETDNDGLELSRPKNFWVHDMLFLNCFIYTVNNNNHFLVGF